MVGDFPRFGLKKFTPQILKEGIWNIKLISKGMRCAIRNFGGNKGPGGKTLRGGTRSIFSGLFGFLHYAPRKEREREEREKRKLRTNNEGKHRTEEER